MARPLGRSAGGKTSNNVVVMTSAKEAARRMAQQTQGLGQIGCCLRLSAKTLGTNERNFRLTPALTPGCPQPGQPAASIPYCFQF